MVRKQDISLIHKNIVLQRERERSNSKLFNFYSRERMLQNKMNESELTRHFFKYKFIIGCITDNVFHLCGG